MIEPDQQERWAIILAGGEGKRLRSLTRRISGRAIPKQFCPVVGEHTLLQRTRIRVAHLVPSKQTMVSVVLAHRPFYARWLGDLPRANVAVQPADRGTACAILFTLLRLRQVAPEATVAIFPSDHYVSDDRVFMHHVDLAFRAATALPYVTLLLGITPDRADPAYGWIEPAEPLAFDQVPVFRVRRFWEKPSSEVAQQLWARGCLWNSFVIVAQIRALFALMRSALPTICAAFSGIRPVFGTVFEEETVERLYADLPSADFSHDALERSPDYLAVLPVSGIEWSDFGEPKRVLEVVARIEGHVKRGAA
jgi:mannose-1-phosphate guanylyltransferase